MRQLSPTRPLPDRPPRVRSHSASAYWDGSYTDDGVESTIHSERTALVLDWIDRLGLPTGSPVLDAGCGAGWTAIALAQRAFRVDAVDSSPEMIELTRRNARALGLPAGLRARVGDAHALELEPQSFELVLGIGVLPWLHSPPEGLRELARVTRRGGWVLVSTDNGRRLSHWIDPRFNPLLAPAKHPLARRLGRERERYAHTYLSRRATDRLLAETGLTKVRAATLGFGPFTFLGRSLLPDRAGRIVHRSLQDLADRGLPGLRRGGSQYVVLARKEERR